MYDVIKPKKPVQFKHLRSVKIDKNPKEHYKG